MFGLGKERTKFGKWVDRNTDQKWIICNCGVDKNTVTSLCNKREYKPNGSTKARVIRGLRKNGYDTYEDDFWD